MIEKNVIKKGPPKRDPVCYQVLENIVIPKGTILRHDPGEKGSFMCLADGGKFTIDELTASRELSRFKRVIAA